MLSKGTRLSSSLWHCPRFYRKGRSLAEKMKEQQKSEQLRRAEERLESLKRVPVEDIEMENEQFKDVLNVPKGVKGMHVVIGGGFAYHFISALQYSFFDLAYLYHL